MRDKFPDELRDIDCQIEEVRIGNLFLLPSVQATGFATVGDRQEFPPPNRKSTRGLNSQLDLPLANLQYLDGDV
jgi:hypothetical protein